MREFAERLQKSVFRDFFGGRLTVFLCGRSLADATSLRAKIAEAIERSYFRWLFQIIYPEDLFEELLSGPNHTDLLSLENVLADGVDAVVIVPESLGSAAELGAFANHSRLRAKLVCIQDERFKKDKSFLNNGPLRLLRDKRVGRIVAVDANHVAAKLEEIYNAVRWVHRKTSQKGYRVNAINASQFLLPAIYLLEPVDKHTLVTLVRFASSVEDMEAAAIVAAGLSVLSKQGMVERSPAAYRFSEAQISKVSDGYKLSTKGREEFRSPAARLSRAARFNLKELDQLRSEVINLMYRGRPMRFPTSAT
jgi:hypothetical protein